jgi:hypothetical protein
VRSRRRPCREVEGAPFPANDDIRIENYFHLSAGGLVGLRAVRRSRRQALASSGDNSVSASAPARSRPEPIFSLSGAKRAKRSSVFEKHNGDVLIVGAVDTIGEIASRFCALMVVFFTKSDHQMFCRTVKAPTAGFVEPECCSWKVEQGVGEDREKGPAALRLCNLVAQSPGDAQGRV